MSLYRIKCIAPLSEPIVERASAISLPYLSKLPRELRKRWPVRGLQAAASHHELPHRIQLARLGPLWVGGRVGYQRATHELQALHQPADLIEEPAIALAIEVAAGGVLEVELVRDDAAGATTEGGGAQPEQYISSSAGGEQVERRILQRQHQRPPLSRMRACKQPAYAHAYPKEKTSAGRP